MFTLPHLTTPSSAFPNMSVTPGEGYLVPSTATATTAARAMNAAMYVRRQYFSTT